MASAKEAQRSAEGRTRWISFAIVPGGAERLDAALERAVGPTVAVARPQRWSFLRWVDARGPHVRLALDGGQLDHAAAAQQLADGLEGLDDVPVRDNVLPLPASQRGAGHRGVERLELADPDAPTDPLHQLSSEVVLAALPELPRGRERFAFGLSLMTALSDAALKQDARAAFWEDLARRWTGADERGRRLLEQLARYADRLGGDLVEQARELRDRGAPADTLARYAEACENGLDCDDPERTRRHAHLTSNRLGVTPLEEALLASVLATGVRTTAASPGPAVGDGAFEPQVEPNEVVEVAEVSKEGEDWPVLEDVSFSVREGETFGLLGPEGAGKSSLLGIAAGLRVSSGGSVRVLGRDPRRNRAELSREIATSLPDEEFAENSTVRENLELAARGGGGDLGRTLEAVGLLERARTRVIDLDRGERRRLVVATALLSDPAVLLLDEPTAGLSPVERESVWRIFLERHEAGATTILATSSLQEAVAVCDRAALIVGGSVVSIDSPAKLAEDHFARRSVHFSLKEEPDSALLEDLPDVLALRVDERADHWAVEIETLQPDELLKLLGADPEFPRIVSVSAEDLAGTFTRPEPSGSTAGKSG